MRTDVAVSGERGIRDRGVEPDLSLVVENQHLRQQLQEIGQVKESLLRIIAHDLRAPLGVIQGYLGLLLDPDEPPRPDDLRPMLLTVGRECAAVLALIDDLVCFGRAEPGNLQTSPMPLSSFLEDAVQTWAALGRERGQEIRLDLQEPLPEVPLDSRRMLHAIRLLLLNAVRCSPPNETIQVRARPLAHGAEVTVRDLGPTFSAAEVPGLFSVLEPSRGDKRNRLGLATVKRVVEAHGGQVVARGEVPRGACIGFTLPVRGGEP